MKKLKLVFLSAMALGLFVASCDKQNEEQINNLNTVEVLALGSQDLRQQLADGSIHFVQLSEEQALSVTLDKVNQILTNNLPDNEELLLNSLLLELPKFYDNQSNTVVDIFLQLANLIPEDDFILMFYDYSDYIYSGSYIGNANVSAEILSEIAGLTFNGGIVQEKPKKQLYCDCNWTCGSYNSDCISTHRGCGMIWRYPCEYIDLITSQ